MIFTYKHKIMCETYLIDFHTSIQQKDRNWKKLDFHISTEWIDFNKL